MPLPKPDNMENLEKFMQRCMSDSVMIKEFPMTEQRLAVCSVQWRESKKS